MKLRRELFLEQFDSSFRNHIVEFSKRITSLSKEYDVLIFLARKAACLADCFDELQLSHFHCIVTSSRILDMNLSWMHNKKVAIIDDTLISGTTICNAKSKLEKAGVSQIDVYVLSVDESWWATDLVDPQPGYFRLNTKQTSLICSNIVKAISVVPRPYNIDYPLYKNIRIREKDFQDLSNSGNWIVYESTSHLQEKHNILNLTIAPSEMTLYSFLNNIGLRIDNDTCLFKLRLYALKINDAYWCQILPIIILPALTDVELEKIFNKICGLSSNNELINWFCGSTREDSLKSKLRLIQYYLGTKFSEQWYKDLKPQVDSNITFEHDFKNLNFVFPPPISNEIKNICTNNDLCFSSLNISFEKECNEIQQCDGVDFDELTALYKVAKPFVRLFDDKELAARNLVKEHGREVFDNKEYRKIVNRLNQGFSIYDLKSFLKGTSLNINLLHLVSYFLDLYIDKGAVVPITYVKGNLVYRAFRHGEDVEFSENEIRLCTLMLQSFAKNYGSNLIPHTIVEKLLVLFIRVGIEKDFLTISTNPISDYNTVGIRYYLHGAIVGSFEKSIYKISSENSLTHLLEETGCIHRNKFSDPYSINKVPDSGTEIRGVHVAKQLGLTLGKLLEKDNAKITLDELILLSTCPYVIDVIGAMAAEIHIFQGFYYYQGQHYFKNYNSVDKECFANLRKQKAFTAINSGTWKYDSFKTGKPWAIIEKAYTSLLEVDEMFGEVWKGFWPSTGKETSTSTANVQLIPLMEKLAQWLYSTRFYINLAHAAITDSIDELNNSNLITEFNSILGKVKDYFPSLFKELDKAYQRAISKYRDNVLNKKALYDYAVDAISKNYHLGRQLLIEVDALASNFGKPDKIAYYEHALLVDFKSFNCPKSKLIKLFNEVVNQIRIEAKKNGVYIFEIPRQYAVIKTGHFLCSTGVNARRWLLKISQELINKCRSLATMKFSFFFHLQNFRIIKNKVSNQCYSPLFWEIGKELLKRKSKTIEGNEIIYFTSSETNTPAIENEIHNELKNFEQVCNGMKDFTINKPYSIQFHSNHYIDKKRILINNIMDIGIITIVAEELAAVIDYFKENQSLNEITASQSSRVYYSGTLEDANHNKLQVVATQTLNQGNRSVIAAYNAISEEYNPQIIVLLGIAGSINDKVNICDVAIADSIYYYDKRAVTDEGIKHRIDSFKVNPETIKLIMKYHLDHKSEEPILDAAENSVSETFKSFWGPIGSGEAVIKYKDAEERNWLLSVNDKTLAVETEAGGVGQQFYEDELSYSRKASRILIIRGISDKADVEKKDEWRLAAAKNAMTVLAEICKSNELIK